MTDKDEEYLTTSDLAHLTHSTQAAVHQMRARGEGPRGFKIGNKILFRRDDIEQWIATRREPERTA